MAHRTAPSLDGRRAEAAIALRPLKSVQLGGERQELTPIQCLPQAVRPTAAAYSKASLSVRAFATAGGENTAPLHRLADAFARRGPTMGAANG
jgi:hypothetical protein